MKRRNPTALGNSRRGKTRNVSTRRVSKRAIGFLILLLALGFGPANAEELGGLYHFAGLESAGGTLVIRVRRFPACSLSWQPTGGRRTRGIGLLEDDLLGTSLNFGSAAFGLMVFQLTPSGWRGQWISSVVGADSVGEIQIEGATLAGLHRFTAHCRAGAISGNVQVTPRGPACLMKFTSASGLELYRGLGVKKGDRLAVAWSFGGTPVLGIYQVSSNGLEGQRLTLPRGGGDATVLSERLTKEDADDTLFPPQLPRPPGRDP